MVRVLLFALATYASSEVTWYQHYESGIEHIQRGEAAAARAELESALRARPQPGLRVRTYGMSYVDYLPHLYLAIACQMSGEVEAARKYLQVAEADGLAAQSETGRTLLEAYRVLLKAEPLAPGPADLPPPVEARRREPAEPSAEVLPFQVYERRPEALSEAEYQQVLQHVLARCQLAPDAVPREAPWYFHYEMGLELARRGDPQRALDALIEAVSRRREPQRQARIYGMWFKDYLPYLEIARMHALLGNWQCVADAAAMSRRMGEISSGDEEFFELQELTEEAGAHHP